MTVSVGACAFLSIPLEVLRLIFRDIPRSDLHQLRLTSPYFYQLTSELLFASLIFYNSCRSERRLASILTATSCAQYVRFAKWDYSRARSEHECILDRDGRLFYLLNREDMLLDDIALSNRCKYLPKFPNLKKVTFVLGTPALANRKPTIQYSNLSRMIEKLGLRGVAIEADGSNMHLSYTTVCGTKKATESEINHASNEHVKPRTIGLGPFIIHDSSTLEQVDISNQPILFLGIVETILNEGERVKTLRLVSVGLHQPTIPSEEILLQFLTCIRNRKRRLDAPPIFLELSSVFVEDSSAAIDASDEELTSWAKDGDDVWLARALSKLRPQ